MLAKKKKHQKIGKIVNNKKRYCQVFLYIKGKLRGKVF